MPETTQLNTRINPGLKRRGDAVFARAGLTPSEVVRRLWKVAADTQEVPACLLEGPDEQRSERLHMIERGAGLALNMARDMGYRVGSTPMLDFDALRDEMYDEMAERMESQHV